MLCGVQAIYFSDGDSNVRVSSGTPKTYFVVLETAETFDASYPSQFRVGHLSDSGTSAEDWENDLELTREYSEEIFTGTIELKKDYALEFDGSGDYVSISYDEALNPDTFTFEAWAYVSGGSGTWRNVMTNREGSCRGPIIYAGTNDQWQIWLGDESSWKKVIGDSVVMNTWTHLAGTYDGSTLSFYINGELQGTTSVTQSKNTSGNFVIGGGYSFDGMLDEFRVWNIVRSQSEIQENMEKTLAGDEDGLVAYYPFDEGSGTIIEDATGSGYDGSKVGNVQWVDRDETTLEGTLTVNIELSDDSDPTEIGIKWSVDETTWYDSGETVTLVQGDYIVTFSTVTGYDALSEESVSVSDGSSETITVTMQKELDYALDFNGSSDYVELPNESDFDFSETFTVELWMQVDSFNITWQAIIAKGDDSWRISRNKYYNTIHFAATKSSGGYMAANGSTNVNDGKWHHLACVADGDHMYLYVDGLLDAQTTMTDSINNSSYPVYIANNAQRTSRYFNGKIDDVRIWNTARTQTEIQDNIGNTLTGNEDGLVAYYPFNEGSGSTLTDSSSSGNDGTIKNSPEWIESQAMAVGSLTVDIEITGDVDPDEIGAKWSVDEVTWYDSGEKVNFVEGDYVVTFNTITGYYSSSDESVSIVDGENEQIYASYSIAQGGTMLMMTLLPKDINKEGAMWNLNNGDWSDASEVFDVSNGDYIVHFKTIDGWNTPESQKVRLSGGTSFITAEYMPPNLSNLIQTLQVLCEIWQPQGTELLDMNENDRVDLIDAMRIMHSMSLQ
jgi:hypothetical protein